MLLAIIDDVFRQLKEIIPEVNSVYIRSDNAGCYHCAFSLLSVYHVAREHAIELKRFDFSDPQGGKGSCDRKAATIKSHMRTHLNKPKQKPVLEEIPPNRENSDDDESCNDKGSDLSSPLYNTNIEKSFKMNRPRTESNPFSFCRTTVSNILLVKTVRGMERSHMGLVLTKTLVRRGLALVNEHQFHLKIVMIREPFRADFA